MSRIGRMPVPVPAGVDVKIDGSHIVVKGKKGQLERDLHSSVSVKMEDGKITVTPNSPAKSLRCFHGLTRSLLNNMVVGVSEGFTKALTLKGVGYRAASKGSGAVTLTIGFSHPVEYKAPEGIDISVDKSQTEVVISGVNKEVVGQVAADIRKFRPPEPYHGKGIRYKDEVIITKVGKKSGK